MYKLTYGLNSVECYKTEGEAKLIGYEKAFYYDNVRINGMKVERSF